MLAAVALLLAPDAPQTPAKPALAGEKRICRALEVTGSIMSTRVCRTREQWVQFDAEHQRAMDNRRNSNTLDRSQSGDAGAGADSFGQSNR